MAELGCGSSGFTLAHILDSMKDALFYPMPDFCRDKSGTIYDFVL